MRRGGHALLLALGASFFFFTRAGEVFVRSASHDDNVHCVQRRGVRFHCMGVLNVPGRYTSRARLVLWESASVAQKGIKSEAAQVSHVNNAHVSFCVIGGRPADLMVELLFVHDP